MSLENKQRYDNRLVETVPTTVSTKTVVNKEQPQSPERTTAAELYYLNQWIKEIWITTLQQSYPICDAFIQLVILSSSSVSFISTTPQRRHRTNRIGNNILDNKKEQETTESKSNETDEPMIDARLSQLVAILFYQAGIPSRLYTQPTNHGSEHDDDSDDDDDDDDDNDEKSNYDNNQPHKSIRFLVRSLTNVAQVWSQSSFLRQTTYNHQRHITYFLWNGLHLLANHYYHYHNPNERSSTGPDEVLVTSTFVSNLLMGVTRRLQSSNAVLRLDGMWIGQKLAVVLQQNDLVFEELNSSQVTKDREDYILSFYKLNPVTGTIQTDIIFQKQSNRSNVASINDDNTKSIIHGGHNGDNTKEEPLNEVPTVNDDDDDDSYHDDDSVWDEDANDKRQLYDIDDDEEDLRAVARPLYLNECLDLLRTPESDENAYSRHLAALQELPTLIQAQPSDLPDVAPSLAVQLLRMENKFSIETFSDYISTALCTLTVQEPYNAGQTLIEEFFRDGSLTDRLNVLQALSQAAQELSSFGNDSNKKNQDKSLPSLLGPRISGRTTLIQSKIDVKALTKEMKGEENTSEDGISRTQRWGNAKKTGNNLGDRSAVNKFTSIAPLWFYALLTKFIEHRDESRLWGGEIGATLLANFLITLSHIVACSGRYDNQSHILAKDLIQLVWTFRNADVAEVRMSVLFAVGTSLDVLPGNVAVQVLFGDVSVDSNITQAIQMMVSSDPDDNCRSLSQVVLGKIASTVQSIESPIRVLK